MNTDLNNRVLCRGGRTGTKVHLSTSRNSSVTHCGLRLRGQARHFMVGADTTAIRTAVAERLCEKCFGLSPVIDIDAAFAAMILRNDLAASRRDGGAA